MTHTIRHRLEYALFRLIWTVFAALPLTTASNLGAAIGSVIGRIPTFSRRVERNLRRAMPELSPATRAAIQTGVWRNLGRTAAELPHVGAFSLTETAPGQGQIQVVGAEYIGDSAGSLLFLAHLANWELVPAVTAKMGRSAHLVYRAINNPLIDQWIMRLRANYSLGALAKGPAAARGIIAALKQGQSVGMLVDQKMNDGIPVPFFGQPAMTAPALAQLALRQNRAVIPLRCERLDRAAFRFTIHPPLNYANTGDRAADVAALMGQVNDLLESWIRERPEQWLWPHNRWPKQD